jgi:hypothetical protein
MQIVHFMLYDRQSQAQGQGHYQNKWLKMRQHSQNVGPKFAKVLSQVPYFANVLTLELYLTLVDFLLSVGCSIQWYFEGPSSLEKVHGNFNCL